MTIWGRPALEFSAPPESVIAAKGVKVSDFNGRSLSLFSSSVMQIDPDIEEAHTLNGWYKNVGRNESFTSHATMGVRTADGRERNQDERKTLGQVKDEGLGMGETADYFTSLATVVFIRQETVSYPACHSEGCKKKVVEDGNGQWRCERCDKSWDKPLHRYRSFTLFSDTSYIMTVSVNDHTSQAWFSLFDEVAQKLLGVDANTLVEYKENDTAKANDVFNKANFSTWTWRVRGRQDNFQGQMRVRYQVLDAWPVDYKRESESLVKLIQSY
jgi:replication factor A1